MVEESKREKFKRLASQRTQAVLDKLRVLGNCSNTYNYEYDESDARQIFRAIEDEVRNIKIMFTANKEKKFSL